MLTKINCLSYIIGDAEMFIDNPKPTLRALEWIVNNVDGVFLINGVVSGGNSSQTYHHIKDILMRMNPVAIALGTGDSLSDVFSSIGNLIGPFQHFNREGLIVYNGGAQVSYDKSGELDVEATKRLYSEVFPESEIIGSQRRKPQIVQTSHNYNADGSPIESQKDVDKFFRRNKGVVKLLAGGDLHPNETNVQVRDKNLQISLPIFGYGSTYPGAYVSFDLEDSRISGTLRQVKPNYSGGFREIKLSSFEWDKRKRFSAVEGFDPLRSDEWFKEEVEKGLIGVLNG